MKIRCEVTELDGEEIVEVSNATVGYHNVDVKVNNFHVIVKGEELIKAIQKCIDE